MDTQKLKLYAERLRAYLKQYQLILKHGQVLDLIAAIPGLRNWPEVNAFPASVATVQWDNHAATRLAQRLIKQYALTVPVDELHLVLEPNVAHSLKIWPAGPVPGVYITTSQEALDSAIARYEVASEGALLYAEGAGQCSEGAIELGEYGLFSRGMERLPSGTLVVIGSLALTQEAWEDNKNRLSVAASLAYTAELRIVVLVETPLPDNLHSDIELLLRSDQEGIDRKLANMLGVITKAGDLQIIQPFVKQRQSPALQHFTTAQRLPPVLEDALKQAIACHPYGLISLGISSRDKSRKALIEALLPLTEHAGPVVRIQPTFSSGYAKYDTPMSPYFVGIPVFPSIESAYDHGFRRMVIESVHHGASRAMAKYAHDTCFLLNSHSAEVAGVWMDTTAFSQDGPHGLDMLTAVLCVADIEVQKERFTVCDAFIASGLPYPTGKFGDLIDHMEAHRIVRWEDQLETLLSTDKVTPEHAQKALRRHDVNSYLEARNALTNKV